MLAPPHRLSVAAGEDIATIVTHSEGQFGAAAGRRYEALLRVAIWDVASAPVRPGSVARPELGARLPTYHLRHSAERARIPEGAVRRPRHLLLYRIGADGVVGIGRVLHDAMDLRRHLPDDYGGS